MSRVQASFRFCARIRTMNHPLTRPPATLSPIGGEGRGEGVGSWVASTIPASRIGTMNPIVLVLVLVLVLETKLAGRGRVRERGRGRRDGSWKGYVVSHPKVA